MFATVNCSFLKYFNDGRTLNLIILKMELTCFNKCAGSFQISWGNSRRSFIWKLWPTSKSLPLNFTEEKMSLDNIIWKEFEKETIKVSKQNGLCTVGNTESSPIFFFFFKCIYKQHLKYISKMKPIFENLSWNVPNFKNIP